MAQPKWKTLYLPLVVVMVFLVGMVLAIEEYLASQGTYKVTIWDRLSGNSEVPEGRAEVSQQVASQLCKNVALKTHGRNLLQSKFDERATRYNPDLKVHTIFIDLTLKGRERESIYIRCDISAVNRQILESRIKGGNRGFGLFGN